MLDSEVDVVRARLKNNRAERWSYRRRFVTETHEPMLHRIIGNALRSYHSVDVYLKDQLRCRAIQRSHNTIFTSRGWRQAGWRPHAMHHEAEEIVGVRPNRENRVGASRGRLHQFHADFGVANIKRVSRNITVVMQADGLRYRSDH